MRPLARQMALAGALAVLPLAAAAEGARQVFDCRADDGTATRFTIAPVALDASGKGDITVTRDGQDFSGTAASRRGPFQFGTDTDNFAFVVDDQDDDGRLRVRLHHVALTDNADAPFEMTLTSLTCETEF
jgi:hypothetical protein